MEQDPYGQIRMLSRGAKAGLTFSAALNLSLEIAKPFSRDQAMAQAVAQMLAGEQIDWQNGTKAAIREDKLLKSLNHHLELEGAAAYLQLQQFELWKIRRLLWAEVPELVTGPDRKQLRVGSRIFQDRMSPIEAYMVATLLVFHKLNSDEYLRTEAEEEARRSRPAQPKKPGLHLAPLNPRILEFQGHLARIAGRKWSTTSAAIENIRKVLEEGRR